VSRSRRQKPLPVGQTNAKVHRNVSSENFDRTCIIMRSPEQAARDAAVHAMDLRGPIGAANESAASFVEVSVMLPTCSPRCERLQQKSCSSKTSSAQIAAHQPPYSFSAPRARMVSRAVQAVEAMPRDHT
jgi:hypothetical protein